MRISGEKESEKVNDVGGGRGRAAARPRYAQVENCMTEALPAAARRNPGHFSSNPLLQPDLTEMEGLDVVIAHLILILI